jgi:hypothetical protein
MSENQGGKILPETIEVTNIHDNVAQEVIRITVDRLKLVLSEHAKHLEARRQWVAPLGILVTILMAFATTSFTDFYFSADTWRAFFVLSGIMVFIWLFKSSLASFRSRRVEDIIEELKNSPGSKK